MRVPLHPTFGPLLPFPLPTEFRMPLSRSKKSLIAAGAVLLLGAAAVAFAPVYLRGYARGVIAREVGASVNGTVTVGGVELGWFSPQRVESLAILGGAETGSVTVNAEVAQGLLALATGDEVTVRVSGRANSPIDAEGRLGLAKLARARDAAPAADGAKPAPAPGGAQKAAPLGGRTIRVELAGIDLSVTEAGAPRYSIDGLTGSIVAKGADAGGLAIDGSLKAATGIAQDGAITKGGFDSTFSALLPENDDGSLDARAATGSLTLSATNLPVPSAQGERIVAESVRIRADLLAGGSTLEANASLRAGSAQPAAVTASVTTGRLFDAGGALALDPAAITADVTVTALPTASLQPYAPELREGVRLDLAADLGPTADLRIAKKEGGRASVILDSQRVKLSFDGAVAADGARIEGGVLEASVSVRPELLRAFDLDAAGPLVARIDGAGIEWSRPERAGSQWADAFGGEVTVELARALALRGVADGVDVRADSARIAVVKPRGAANARATVDASGVYGAESAVRLSARADIDLATRAVTAGSASATAALDAALLPSWTNGAVAPARGGATVAIDLAEFAYRPAEGRGALQSLALRGGIRVDGELAVTGGESSANLRGVDAAFALPTATAPGTIALSARVDGAETRVSQRFARIPAEIGDFAAFGFEGSVDVRGLDPSVVARFAPAAKDSLGALGEGPVNLTVANRTEGGALSADFTLAAAALNATGGARLAKDAFSLTNLACDAALSPEMLAALKVPDTVAIARGARATVRVPALALAKGADGWAPSGDLAARIAVSGLRLERAPGLSAALDVPALEADATYSIKTERATAKGSATLGAGGAAGRVGYDLAWRKPAEARLFRGVEGTVALSQFDLARLEGALGLEPGAYSGILGGAGGATVELREQGSAQAKIALDFPKTRGAVTVDVVEENTQRVARAAGSVDAEIAAKSFAALAGLGEDPKRRVAAPVRAALSIRSARVPLDDALKPIVADASIDIAGTLSPVSIEITGADRRTETVSTGALALAVTSARLSDEVVVRVTGDGARDAAAGAIEIDARVRGAVARSTDAEAAPIVDATVKATKFPAASIDAFAATGGAVGRYLGDAIDANIVARGLSKTQGTLAATLSSPFASLEAPALSISDGFLRSGAEKPMRANFTLSPEIREQLLTPINPVFSDVTSKERARFTLTSLAWPMDGDRRRFDAAFTLETGEITLTNSGPLSFLLSALQAGRTEGFEAQIDPLRVTVSKGRLTYRDFTLRAGKTQQGAWRNSLVFSGDVDLASVPMRANEIKTAIPLSDAANWSSDARGILEAIGAASPELLKSLTVGLKLSGPLFDASGKPAKLKQELALPDVGQVLRDNPGAVIDAVGDIFDAFRKRDKKK